MRNLRKRNPENYDGTGPTSYVIGDVLSSVLSRISNVQTTRPDMVLTAWSTIIGPQLAPMTQAVSVVDGVLTVKVKNSSLHSLLSRHEKQRILAIIQKKFPKAGILNINFRIA